MKKKNEVVHIGSVINKVLKTHRHEFDEDLTKVWSLWNNAVGEPIAKNTRPAAFRGKLLLVNVVSSTWMHELKFLKKDIIKKINEALGKTLVEEIKFKIGPV